MENPNRVTTQAYSSINEKRSDSKKNGQEFPQREVVSSLMYLAVGCRPDISFALGVCSRHMKNLL